jgi:hypothetical protein
MQRRFIITIYLHQHHLTQSDFIYEDFRRVCCSFGISLKNYYGYTFENHLTLFIESENLNQEVARELLDKVLSIY